MRSKEFSEAERGFREMSEDRADWPLYEENPEERSCCEGERRGNCEEERGVIG